MELLSIILSSLSILIAIAASIYYVSLLKGVDKRLKRIDADINILNGNQVILYNSVNTTSRRILRNEKEIEKAPRRFQRRSERIRQTDRII